MSWSNLLFCNENKQTNKQTLTHALWKVYLCLEMYVKHKNTGQVIVCAHLDFTTAQCIYFDN